MMKYISGDRSIHLRKGKLGTKGYGVYATNKRIFRTEMDIILTSDMTFLLSGVIGHLVLDNTTKSLIDRSIKSIEELERNEDFEVKKEDIAFIEWKKVNL